METSPNHGGCPHKLRGLSPLPNYGDCPLCQKLYGIRYISYTLFLNSFDTLPPRNQPEIVLSFSRDVPVGALRKFRGGGYAKLAEGQALSAQ